MALTNAATNLLANAIIGTSYTPFDSSDAFLGVGDSSNVFAPAQTDLQATTNKTRKPMNSTFPTVLGNVITFQATFGTGDANYAWNEWGVFNSGTSGTMLNRKVESLGTKPNTQIWVLTTTITVNNP